MPKGGLGPGGRSGCRPAKKKPPPNRHSLANRIDKIKKASEKEPEPPRPSSASENKLEDKDAKVDAERAQWSGFRLVDIDKIFDDISAYVSCRNCRREVKITEKKTVGLSSLFELTCPSKCGVLKTFRNCGLVKGVQSQANESEANRRLIYSCQVLGVKHSGMQKLCALIDLPAAVTQKTYDKTVKIIHETITEQSEECMKKAAELEAVLERSRDLTVSGDGTWQKRGFSSKNGAVSLIGAHTGKVLDVEAMTTVCFGCANYKGPKEGPEFDEWKEDHAANCSINHTSSSGMMEVNGIVRIFNRSQERANVRYSRYIGDGDSKTHPAVVTAKPYGDDLIPQKVECTGHVQKRMGTRLRNLKKDYKKQKLSDGKTIGGKGRLTDKKIDQIASFYGNAIRSSTFVREMKDKIWAIFYRYRSSDKEPEHHLCPKGETSWCRYQVAVAKKEVKKLKHTSSLPTAVMDVMKTVFEALTDDELLQRCVGGFTQNPNESFNAVVWKNVPKTVFCGIKVLEIGIHHAVLIFNDGQKSHLDTLRRLGVIPGTSCVFYCNQTDQIRVNKSKRRSLESTKEARIEKRRREKEEEERKAAAEGPSYAAGAF